MFVTSPRADDSRDNSKECSILHPFAAAYQHRTASTGTPGQDISASIAQHSQCCFEEHKKEDKNLQSKPVCHYPAQMVP